ncbi:MAG: hypothetical protein ACLP1Q_09945 [Solirubrobacteraceae bacterium]
MTRAGGIARELRRHPAPRRRIGAGAVAAVLAGMALHVGPAAAQAGWRTETLSPAGVVGPTALSFDPAGDGLLVWAGNPYALQSPRLLDGGETRVAGGGWGQTPELPFTAIEQLQLYGSGRAMLVGSEAVTASGGARPPGTLPCCAGYPGTVLRVRVIYADGSADGSFGPVRVLDQNGSTPVSAADERGDAIVAWVHGGRFRVAGRSLGGAFGKPLTFPGPALAGEPFTVALNARGERLLAWVDGRDLYARVRPARGPWGPSQLVARLPVPARPVPTSKLRAAITPAGTIVLAWESASSCEGCATVLRAGAAWHAPVARAASTRASWRVFTVERSSIAADAPGGAVAAGLAGIAPLVDSFGHVYLAWTGGLEGSPIVKLAELTASGIGFWTPLSDSLVGGALDDATAGPDGALLVSWFDVRHATSAIGPVYASLRRGSGRFELAVRLTGEDVTGGSGLVAFQPLSGEALVVSGVIVGGVTTLQVSTDAGTSRR